MENVDIKADSASTINARFMEAFLSLGKTSRAVAIELGLNVKTFWSYTNQGKEPSYKCVTEFCNRYKDFSFEYIMYGVGELYRQKKESIPNNEVKDVEKELGEQSSPMGIMESMYKEIIDALKGQIDLLKSRCSTLEEQNKILKELAEKKN